MSKNYSSTKSQYVQNQMKSGTEKRDANRMWCKSEEKRSIDEEFQNRNLASYNEGKPNSDDPMQDWANTSDDF